MLVIQGQIVARGTPDDLVNGDSSDVARDFIERSGVDIAHLPRVYGKKPQANAQNAPATAAQRQIPAHIKTQPMNAIQPSSLGEPLPPDSPAKASPTKPA